MLSEDRQRVLDRLLDGELSDAERSEGQASLENDPEAMDWLADRALLHANLRRSMERRGIEALASQDEKPAPQKFPSLCWAMAAMLMVLLGIVFWPRQAVHPTFATLEQTRSALWQSGELPTADGSRLGAGTLRLAEGLAILQFDSGAEVILEAPAELVLVDAMNCKLTRGTVVSDIPESALGFRVQTPTADVVDYGTRFAVSVHEGTGETHTQVMEGRVQVEHALSGAMVELSTGQRNTVTGETLGGAAEGKNPAPRTIPVEPVDHGPDWVLLEPVKDAYTGHVKGHESDVLLYVKKAIHKHSPHRTAYLGYDLDGIERDRIAEAELLLFFAPTGWGLASFVPDATFSVYALDGEVPDWDESILRNQFPSKAEGKRLGSFTLPKGVQKGRFRVSSDALNIFLREHPNSAVTFKVVRDTRETEDGGLVHGFASRRHPVLPAPTLAIRMMAP